MATGRRVLATLAVLGLVAGCNGSDDPEEGLSEAEQAELETASVFARCMRDEGLEAMPDPEVTEDGFMLVGAPLDRRDFAVWDTAQEACQSVVEESQSGDEGAASAEWEEVVPGGDCQCSDGSEFNFWVHQGDPSKVVVYFQGGGACFSAETCDPENELYNTTVTEGPTDEGGIFDLADERNPFAEYSFVYVPYCTGDVFIGNATTTYSSDLTIQHKGYANGTAALDHLTATFPAASEVVVLGTSAGSVAAPLYGGLVADRFPDARITVLADGSGSYPDAPEITDVVSAAWGTADAIPDWPENAGLTASQWSSVPGLFVQSGHHDPEIVFARHDYAYDENQASWFPLFGLPLDDLLSYVDANEAQIEAAGVQLHSYIAPGGDHTVLTDGQFYTEEVEGQLLVDWVTRLVDGDPVEDVHCDECASG